MAFDKRTLFLPAGTRFEEHTIVTGGDFILGNRVKLGFGIHDDGRVFLGQGVLVDGGIFATGDLRMDQSGHILGDVECGGNAYIGERCFVQGDFKVDGDMDVGDDVRVGGALHAKGWVNKRNPVPVVIYMFIYLLELLRLGQSEQVDRLLSELDQSGDDDIAVNEVFLFVPDETRLGLDRSTVQGNLDMGPDCRLLGNFRVHGGARLAANCRVFGALHADGTVRMEDGSEVQGTLRTDGHVVVGPDCQILGDLQAKSVDMYPGATVDGKIIAAEGVSFRTERQLAAQAVTTQKVQEMSTKSVDLVDLLG